jgi:hypothetical protein
VDGAGLDDWLTAAKEDRSLHTLDDLDGAGLDAPIAAKEVSGYALVHSGCMVFLFPPQQRRRCRHQLDQLHCRPLFLWNSMKIL